MTDNARSWDAIIINFNGGLFLEPCLRAITQNNHPPRKLIVVDNASTDDSLNELAGWPQADLIRSHVNLGYAGGANLGMQSSEAPVAVFLNPDVELDRDYGRHVCDLFEQNPRLGVAGAKLRFPGSGRIQHAGGIVHWPVLTTSHAGEREDDQGQFDDARDVDFVTGAALAVRRTAFDSIGGFDETFHPAYWEDVDFCWRTRQAGFAVRYQPELTAIHHEGAGQPRSTDYFYHWTQNRLRFAMTHLTSRQWWQEFIPAEIERLRGELSAVETPDWWVNSGADSIEQLARAADLSSTQRDSVADPGRLNDVISAVRELPALADPRPGPIRPSDGVLIRVKRFLSRFSGRLYAEELYWHQRQFNESVVRAFEAQDRFNREIVVQLLLTLLIAGRRRDGDLDGTEHL